MDLATTTILVTGGSGFLGRHLLQQLRDLGCAAINAPRSSDCDLTQPDQVRRLLQDVRPDLVFHLAARVGGIGANRREPGTFLFDNLAMGLHLIEECRRANVQKIVLAGTICSYPKFTQVPFREADLWNGYPEETNAPYGLAKKMLMVQLQAYRQQFGFLGVTLLLTNLYGPGDNFDPQTSHVIPALMERFIQAKVENLSEVTVWGTGTATREFLFVADAARALILAAQRLNSPEPVNIGSGEEISIAGLAALIADEIGYAGKIVFDPKQPDGQPRRRLDLTRAWETLGFAAQTTLAAGLKKTVDWYHRLRLSETKSLEGE